MVNYLNSQPENSKPKQASLHAVVDYLLGQQILEDNGKQKNWMLRHFQQYPQAVDKVMDTLEQNGLQHFDLVGMGARSIVLEAAHDQMVRITLDKTVSEAAKSVKHAAILQPIKVLHTPGPRLIRIEITPKVSFKDVTEEEEYSVMDVLASSRLGASDIIGNQNVGVIEVDGKRVPLLVDYSELELRGIPFDGIDKTLIGNWLSKDNIPLQKIYDPRIGTGIIKPETPTYVAKRNKKPDDTYAEHVKSKSSNTTGRHSLH